MSDLLWWYLELNNIELFTINKTRSKISDYTQDTHKNQEAQGQWVVDLIKMSPPLKDIMASIANVLICANMRSTVEPHLSGLFTYPDIQLGNGGVRTHVWEAIQVSNYSDSLIQKFSYTDSWLGNVGDRISKTPLYTITVSLVLKKSVNKWRSFNNNLFTKQKLVDISSCQ